MGSTQISSFVLELWHMFSDSVYINTEHRPISSVVNHSLCRKLFNLFWFHFPNNNSLVIVHSNEAAADAAADDDSLTIITIILIIIIITSSSFYFIKNR